MWLDAPGLALVLLRVRVFDWCWFWRFLAFLTILTLLSYLLNYP
jgi:hypothetical protein